MAHPLKYPSIQVGQTYGTFTISRLVGRDRKSNKVWECECSCGKVFIANDNNIKMGYSKSCGCVHGVKISRPITQEQLKLLLYYDPDTGLFTRIRKFRHCCIGDIAGNLSKTHGYVHISFGKNHHYPAHCLAFFYMTGRWSPEIDHKNRVRSDNKWTNLRECTTQQNRANSSMRSDNTSGYKGVSMCERNESAKRPWNAFISYNRKSINLGLFETSEEAARAYDAKAIELFGDYAAINFPQNLP